MFIHTGHHCCSGNDVLGVVGADVPFSLIYNFLKKEFDPCRSPNVEYVIAGSNCS